MPGDDALSASNWDGGATAPAGRTGEARRMTPLRVEDLRVVATGLDHPEGVAVDADGMVWCGGEAGQVYRVDARTGSVEQVADTGGFCLGVTCDGAGGVYVCTVSDHPAVVRVDARSGELTGYCDSAAGTPLTLPNATAFDAQGTLWLTDSGTEALGVRDGRILAIPPGGGAAEIVATGLHFPNGVCVDAGGHVVLVDTLDQRVLRLDGSSTITLAEVADHSPDGILPLADGGFLVACYYPFRLLHVPAGEPVGVLLDDPTGIHLPMPTNAAFLRDDATEIVIGSLGGQALTAIDIGMPGCAPHRPVA